MEQFTRECLEIDTDAGADGDARPAKAFSMDKVYERAAKLVKKTLDVEGAIVMDVSHADVLETISAEGTMYSGSRLRSASRRGSGAQEASGGSTT